MKHRHILALALVAALAACGTVRTNSDGTPTNAAEQVAGTLYGAYIAADSAWLSYIVAGKATPAQIAAVEPKRKEARQALDAFSAASVKGNAAAEQAAANIAINAFASQLKAYGLTIVIGGA